MKKQVKVATSDTRRGFGGVFMINIMLGLLAEDKQKVSSIISTDIVTCRDLSLAEVRYTQGNTYNIAQSFCTAGWLASSPLGPTFNEDSTLKMDCIEDVATVTSFSSVQEMRRVHRLDSSQLAKVKEHLDQSARQFIEKTYPWLVEMVYKVYFDFVPVPAIQVCLATGPSYKRFLGTVAVQTNGGVSAVSKTTLEVDALVESMRAVGCLPVAKELYYVKNS